MTLDISHGNDSANHIFHWVGVFNLAAGGMLVTIILALTGLSWQRSNITKWIQMETM
jgi:hypothetical protein